jgi:ABC-type multidrug transport system fused ATPase/permease subunit
VKISSLVKLCLSQFSGRDRKTLYLISFLQVLLNLLEILAITLVGVIGALSASYLAGFPYPNWVIKSLEYLKLSSLSTKQTLVLVLIVTSFLFVFKSISSLLINFKIFRFLSDRQIMISTKLSEQFAMAPYEFVKKQNPQSIIFAVTDGINHIVLGILGNFFTGIAEFGLLILIILLLFVFNPITAIFTLIFFGIIAFLVHKVLGSLSTENGERLSLAAISSRNQISNLIYGYKEIFVYGKADFFNNRFSKARAESAYASALSIWLQQMPKYIFEIAMISAAISVVGIQLLQNNATGGISTLIVFLASATRLTPALMRVQVALLQLKNYQPGALISLDLINEMSFFSNKWKTSDSKYTLTSPPKIEFNNVNFKFQDGGIETLSSVSLTIPSGKVTAFVGASGSGKTTLIELMLGIYSPISGDVVFHDGELELIGSKVIGIAYVPQNPFIIDGTLTDNIAIGIPNNLVDESALNFAIRASGLKSVIDALPEGIHTNLVSSASRLSGGEKQRITIARALYTKPRLLIIDEGTSALDGLTEQFITESIFSMANSMTIVLVAHRLSSIKNADVIHYMNQGMIIETGTFDELKQKSPEFAKQVELMSLNNKP